MNSKPELSVNTNMFKGISITNELANDTAATLLTVNAGATLRRLVADNLRRHRSAMKVTTPI
jgi:hypothetical protein